MKKYAERTCRDCGRILPANQMADINGKLVCDASSFWERSCAAKYREEARKLAETVRSTSKKIEALAKKEKDAERAKLRAEKAASKAERLAQRKENRSKDAIISRIAKEVEQMSDDAVLKLVENENERNRLINTTTFELFVKGVAVTSIMAFMVWVLAYIMFSAGFGLFIIASILLYPFAQAGVANTKAKIKYNLACDRVGALEKKIA